ncbi:branched-chain amino acid ABC transporter permease [Haloglomus litoreum]|uniref:branched-chain amino acid ABC transporter permease n=1 Tax=Haloglomus litoreum TaxID=3034026 RepID=UPI0023E7A861|nr:branched-chain amino acid ABC transporter permease [Haloglomus sp. DT116]
MASLVSVGINVLLLGALYALVATGFTLIFGVGGVLNLAHGASLTIGAYSAFYLANTDILGGSTILLAPLLALVVGGLFSLLLWKGMIRFVTDNPVSVLILTLVVSLIVEQVFLALETAQPVVVPNLVDGTVNIGSIGISANRLVIFAVSWVVIGALFYFVNETRTGKAILATSMSTRGASLVGINAERSYTYTWIIAGALAALAGVFLASFQNANPLMGRNPLLLSFSIVIVGGLGSIRGSVIGAYLISLLDQLTVSFISSRLTGVSALIVLVIVLMVKPEGLFGRELVE